MVNGFSAYILFDSGATRLFISLVLSNKFRDAPGTLDSPIEVEIVDDLTMSATRVFRISVLNMFRERFFYRLGSNSFVRIEGDHRDRLVGAQ